MAIKISNSLVFNPRPGSDAAGPLFESCAMNWSWKRFWIGIFALPAAVLFVCGDESWAETYPADSWQFFVIAGWWLFAIIVALFAGMCALGGPILPVPLPPAPPGPQRGDAERAIYLGAPDPTIRNASVPIQHPPIQHPDGDYDFE